MTGCDTSSITGSSAKPNAAEASGDNASLVVQFCNWGNDLWAAWDRFMFAPTDAATLGVIRILTGAMLLYTHFVWTLDLTGFFGEHGWLSKDFVYRYHDSVFGWSHLYWLSDGLVLWCSHLLSLCVFFALMIGFKSRSASVLAYLLAVSYAHRATGALFGLDQINCFLAMYLMIGPSGDAYSLDQWLRGRDSVPRDGGSRENESENGLESLQPEPKVTTCIAIRLIQLHLCVVYLFAGFGKLFGESWWSGTALWGAFANLEYQTLDMTWMAHSLVLVNVVTHVALFWEISYAALIWNRHMRPLMLLLAIPLHLGIATCMGMVTFGLVMLIANLAFVSPQVVRKSAAKLGIQAA